MYVLRSGGWLSSPHLGPLFSSPTSSLPTLLSSLKHHYSTPSNPFALTTIADIHNHSKHGDTIQSSGWVKTVRRQKENTFIEISDGTHFNNLQILLPSSENVELTTGSCISVLGTLIEAPGRKQGRELQNPKITVLGSCDQTYPIHKQGLPVEYLRENANFRARTNFFSSMLRVRNQSMMAIHQYFQDRNFINIHTPILTANDCEGAGELFQVTTSVSREEDPEKTNQPLQEASPAPPVKKEPFFDEEGVYLSVSGQLQAEIFASSMTRVYTFGPTFRAEKSPTPRHLSEFWMIEPEVAFIDHHQAMDMAEEVVCWTVRRLLERCPLEIEFFSSWVDKDLMKTLRPFVEGERFERILYKDAVDVLQRNGMSIKWGDDLQRADEKFLCETYLKKPVFVTDWPASLKPFYMRLNDDEKTVANFDLLVPNIGEIIGGSAREERLPTLLNRMHSLQLNPNNYQWYLDLRRYGSAPHAGFGLGFERFLQFVSGVKNIRDVTPIPRYPGYCKF